MNNLLKELLVLSKQDSMLDKYFSQKFQENCKSFINYMHNPNKSKKHHHQQQLSPNAGSIKKTSWFERLKNVKTEANTETAFAEIVPRRKFGTIKEMLKIAGLLEPDSEYKYLAQKLKEANLTGKYQAVQRFVDIHVGVDMLKILEHYVGGVSGILKDSTIKNGRATTFNAMFTAAYLGIMNNTSSKCYRDVEHGALQRIGDGIKQKKVRFAKLEGGEPRPTLQSIGSKRPAPMEEEEIDIENSLVKSLEFLMSKVQSQINYLIKAQLEGLRPADRAKEMAVNCEVDDELFGQFLNGIEIGPNLLHRGGANCLQGIYDNLAERRSKIIFGEDGQLGILPPSAEPKLNLGPNAIKRNRTPKSGKLEIREPQHESNTSKNIVKKREPSLKSISKSPQKEENGNNESFNVIVALDDLINLFRKARDNLLLAEVELEVPHVAYNDNSACWVDDQLFKQFLNGEPIGQYLLPNGDANKMGTILDYLHDRRDYYAQYQPLDESRLMIRLNSLINRVDKAQKYLAKAEGPYYNPKARTKTRTNEFDNLFKQFLDGKKIGRKFLPKGGSNCMDSFLDNLIQRRENLKNGGDGLLGEQPVVEERHNGEKYGKTRSMPINGSLVPHHSKDIDYNKSHSMPTTEKEYKRTSSERSRSYGRPRDNEITSSVPAPADNESQNSESPPPSWLDTAREWSGWMKDKLNPFNTVNKAETVKKSLTNETITPQKITREISPKKNEKNINDEHFAKPKESPSKNNVVHVNASTGRNTNKISPPRDQPSTPGLAPNQRPKITVSPDTPIKSSPKSPKSPTESPLSANSDSSKTTTSSSTSDDDIQHQAQQLNIRARITAKTPYGSKKFAATNVPVKDVPESSRSRAVPTHSSDSALLRKNLQKNVPNFMKSKSLGHKNVQNNFARSPKSPTESPLGLMSSSSSATTSPKSPTERPFVGVINSSSSSATTTSSSGTSDDDVEHQAQQFNIRARITAKTPYGSKKSVGTNDAVKGVPKSSRSRAAPTRASKAELLGKNAERNVPNFTKSKSFGHKNTENKIGIRQAAPAKSDVAESSRSRAAPTRSSNPELLRKNAEKRNVPNLMKSKSFGHKNAPNTIGTTRQAAPAQSDSEDDVRLLSTGNQGNITNNTMNHNHDVQLRPIVSRNGRKSSRARRQESEVN
uniref:Uncharacterized protein n=1 Tax=Globodera rostochiensis TaxID=31243 RepID=A0A914IEE5_GLORO